VLPARTWKLSRDRKGQHSIGIDDQFAFASTGRTGTPRTWKSWITIRDRENACLRDWNHPSGEIIREEVLTPLGMSVNQLAKHLSVDAARLNEIVRGRRGITPTPPCVSHDTWNYAGILAETPGALRASRSRQASAGHRARRPTRTAA